MSSLADKQWYRDSVKGNRVFILGAGFSAAAGVPLTGPLLERTMEKFSTECPEIFDRVEGYTQLCTEHLDGPVDYATVNFSALCTYLEYIELTEYGGGERWSDAGSREKLALRFYLAKTLAEHTPWATSSLSCTLDLPSSYTRWTL